MYRITIDRDACDGVFACLVRDDRFVEDSEGWRPSRRTTGRQSKPPSTMTGGTMPSRPLRPARSMRFTWNPSRRTPGPPIHLPPPTTRRSSHER